MFHASRNNYMHKSSEKNIWPKVVLQDNTFLTTTFERSIILRNLVLGVAMI